MPDPNTFGGPISVFRPGNEGWKEMPFAYDYHENSRNIDIVNRCAHPQAFPLGVTPGILEA